MSTLMDRSHVDALANGEVVQRYMIEAVIGRGGFGITYRARHTDDQIVALKEYFPQQRAARCDGMVMPASAAEHAAYHQGLGRFLAEAKALRRLWVVGGTGGGVVKVITVLERNGTGYVVMEHLTGERLDEVLAAFPYGLPAEVLSPLTRHLVGALDHVHDARFRHGDIAPANIMLRANGQPVLVDFAAARTAGAGTEIARHCYAPIEQHLGTEQGAFSDVYALGATLYHAIGGTPIDALTRHRALWNGWADPLTPAIEVGAGRYPVALLRMIDRAVAVPPAARPQSAAALLAVLDGVDTGSAPPPETAGQQIVPPAVDVPDARPALGHLPIPTVTTPARAAPIAGDDARLPPWRRQRSQAIALPLLGVVIVAGLVGTLSWFWLQPAGTPLASVPVVSLNVPARESRGGPEPTVQHQVAAPPAAAPPTAELPQQAIAELAEIPARDVASPDPASPDKATPELGGPSAVEPPLPAAAEPSARSAVDAAKPAIGLAKPAAIAALKPLIGTPPKPPSLPPQKLAALTISPPVRRPIEPAAPDAPRSDVPGPIVPSPEASIPGPSDAPSTQPEPVGLPDVAVGSRIAGPALIYPQTLEESGREGSADIRCTINADGRPGDCKIVDLMGPDGFGRSALAYISGSTYHPARRNGVDVSADMTFHVMFRLGRSGPATSASQASIRPPADSPSMPPEPADLMDAPVGSRIAGPALIYPQTLEETGREGSADVRCTIDAAGVPSDCSIVELTGPDGFGRSALAYISGSTYHPARRNGANVSEDMTFHVVFRLDAQRGR
jgi:TonB family protein